jgi:hypothetical protein
LRAISEWMRIQRSGDSASRNARSDKGRAGSDAADAVCAMAPSGAISVLPSAAANTSASEWAGEEDTRSMAPSGGFRRPSQGW